MAPLTRRSYTIVGTAHATVNASVAAFAPNTAPITCSLTSPSRRLMMLPNMMIPAAFAILVLPSSDLLLAKSRGHHIDPAPSRQLDSFPFNPRNLKPDTPPPYNGLRHSMEGDSDDAN